MCDHEWFDRIVKRLRKSRIFRSRNLKSEHKVFLIVLGGTTIIYLSFFLFSRDLFPDFVTKLLAGFLGVLLGFALDRQIELWKRVDNFTQIMNSFLDELGYNLEFCRRYKEKIVAPAQGKQVENFFDLFQTSIWNMFCSRLELEDVKIQYRLGEIYHNLELFNEATRNEGTQKALSVLLQRNPKYLHGLEQDLDGMTKTLRNELRKLS